MDAFMYLEMRELAWISLLLDAVMFIAGFGQMLLMYDDITADPPSWAGLLVSGEPRL